MGLKPDGGRGLVIVVYVPSLEPMKRFYLHLYCVAKWSSTLQEVTTSHNSTQGEQLCKLASCTKRKVCCNKFLCEHLKVEHVLSWVQPASSMFLFRGQRLAWGCGTCAQASSSHSRTKMFTWRRNWNSYCIVQVAQSDFFRSNQSFKTLIIVRLRQQSAFLKCYRK